MKNVWNLFKRIANLIKRRVFSKRIMINEMASQNTGDQISGKWINTNTGQVVYARQIINDGDVAQVVTDIGIIPMSQFMDYVQMSEEDVQSISNAAQSFSANSNISASDAALLNMATKENKAEMPSLTEPFNKTQEKTKKEQPKAETNKSTIEVVVESPNYKIIDKLFSKFEKDLPKINVSINWGNFPKEQISTLTDIFDIPKEEIAEYLLNKISSNKENIKDEIISYL